MISDWAMWLYGAVVIVWCVAVYAAVQYELERSRHSSPFNGITRKDGEK